MTLSTLCKATIAATVLLVAAATVAFAGGAKSRPKARPAGNRGVEKLETAASLPGGERTAARGGRTHRSLNPQVSARNASDALFSDNRVHELYLEFSQPDFWEQLMFNYFEGNGVYIEADLSFDGKEVSSVGVRFKGSSSMWGYPGDKKPFKIKLDEFVPAQDLFGLTKLSLSNGFRDPTQLREKMFYDAVGDFLPCSRAGFVELYLNGDYWGLYTNVEQVDKRFFTGRFGGSEDGNLFKGDPEGWLVWLGQYQTEYYDKYELKTNESINDWTDLVNFIDILNNTPSQYFAGALESEFFIYDFLLFSVLANLYISLDTYIGEGHNYYIYHREDADRFYFIPWDANEAFGNCPAYAWPDLIALPVFWQRDPGPHPRPLVNRMFDEEKYRDAYLMDYSRVLDAHFIVDSLHARVDALADLVRASVYADTLKMFGNYEFEQNLESDVYMGEERIFGLKSFITDRRSELDQELAGYNIREKTTGLCVNEFLALNDSTLADEFGEYDDWIELYNSGSSVVSLDGLFLTDDPAVPAGWQLPDTVLNPGEFLLVWADKDEEQGPLHADFKLSGGGEFIGLYDADGLSPVDTLGFGPQVVDVSMGRRPDGSPSWVYLDPPTPGTSND